MDLVYRHLSRPSRTLYKDRTQTKQDNKNIRRVINDEQNVKVCYDFILSSSDSYLSCFTHLFHLTLTLLHGSLSQ